LHRYDLNSTGVLEARNRLSFPHPDPSFCVVLHVAFSQPNLVRVLRGSPTGAEVPRITTGVRPTTTDSNPSGANLMDPQARQLIIKVCGGAGGTATSGVSTGSTFWLIIDDRLLLVSAVLAMTVDEFFANDAPNQRSATETFVSNLALLLRINPSQIRVTCVHPVDDPVCLGAPGRRRRSVGGSSVVIDMVIQPLYTVQDVSVTTVVGPNGTNVTATYVTDETVSDADRQAQLEAIFDLIVTNSSDLIDAIADLPGA
jgi:hypothetical protein